ncbi:MAG TPA: hypothetical protein VFM58_18800 [Solirubrobacteraceae bacterium]|jgi:hypothetical protein|nr:hypothetical protein [Solirubrobacteraceae bacterium]
MRFVVVLAALALLAGCGDDDETEAPAQQAPFADLAVTVNDGETQQVRCDTPEDSEVCRALADIDPKTFEPVPGNVACTQQYGGPETATVEGTLDGREIDAKFSRVNGCEIERWETVKPLLEAAG